MLALRGASVVLACRNVESAEKSKSKIVEALANADGPSSEDLSKRLIVMALDLSSLASVRQFAEAFLARGLPLHILMYAPLPLHAAYSNLDSSLHFALSSLATIPKAFLHESEHRPCNVVVGVDPPWSRRKMPSVTSFLFHAVLDLFLSCRVLLFPPPFLQQQCGHHDVSVQIERRRA